MYKTIVALALFGLVSADQACEDAANTKCAEDFPKNNQKTAKESCIADAKVACDAADAKKAEEEAAAAEAAKKAEEEAAAKKAQEEAAAKKAEEEAAAAAAESSEGAGYALTASATLFAVGAIMLQWVNADQFFQISASDEVCQLWEVESWLITAY